MTHKPQIVGVVSVERLTHFRCGLCQKWWSVGDVPLQNKKTWYCAWCGVEQTFTDKTPKNLIFYEDSRKRAARSPDNV